LVFNQSSGIWDETVVHAGFYTAKYKDKSQTLLAAPFRHYDGLKYQSGTTMGMFSFMVLFLPFLLNPHWLQRVMAASSDKSLKKAGMWLVLSGLIAQVPGLYMGIVHMTQLKDCFRSFDPTKPNNGNGCKYPIASGNQVFGTFVWYFLREGGGKALVAGIAGTAAIAAIMSTADSAVIGVGSLITRDFIQGWLAPEMKTKQLMSISKVISFVLIMIGVLVPLYDDNVRDNGIIYGFLIALQCAFLWQALPSYWLALFGKSNNPTPIACGIIGGCLSLIILFATAKPTAQTCGNMKACYASGFANAQDTAAVGTGVNAAGGLWLDVGTYGGLINLAIVLLMQKFAPNFELKCLTKYPDEHVAAFGPKLTAEETDKIMVNVVEPYDRKKSPLGWACGHGAMVVIMLAFPWYGDPYNGCNLTTYTAWKNCKKGISNCDPTALVGPDGKTCKPESFIGGIPSWAFGMHLAWGICMILFMICWGQWTSGDDSDISHGADAGLTKNAVSILPNTDPDIVEKIEKNKPDGELAGKGDVVTSNEGPPTQARSA